MRCALVRSGGRRQTPKESDTRVFRPRYQPLYRVTILGFHEEDSRTFVKLRKLLPRSGTMDLKIASICLEHDALLLTRNLRDFNQVPGLRVENWLD